MIRTLSLGKEAGGVLPPPLHRVSGTYMERQGSDLIPTAWRSVQLSSPLCRLLIAVCFVPVRVNWEHRSSVKYHGS